jgi:hypothetical protein
MSAMCLPAVSANQQQSVVLWPFSLIVEMEKMIQDRIDSAATEIFERAGGPAGKECHARLAAERQVLLSRVRLVECPDSITLFAFVPDPNKRISIFLTSRGVVARSSGREKGQTAEDEQFLVARWGTEIDPHTAYASLDGNTLSLMGWRVDSPKLKNRFKLWRVSNGRNPNMLNADRRLQT